MKRAILLTFAVTLMALAQGAAAQGTYSNEGKVVDKMKTVVAAYEAGDWATYRSAFADTVTFLNNTIPLTLDERTQEHMALRQVFENIHFVNPIYGEVHNMDETWGLLWGTWEGTVKSTGETVQIMVHVASLQAGGKTAAEFGFWDTSTLAPIMEAAMSGR